MFCVVCEQMGTMRRKREIYHVHPLPSNLQDHPNNPESHTHIVHRVREKKRGEPGYNENDEKMRQRKRRQVDLPPVNETAHFCHEDGKIKAPMSADAVLEQTMFVDMADTLVLDEFQPRTTSREFGNNYLHAAIFIDHTMVEKYDGDETFLIRYHLAMFNIVSFQSFILHDEMILYVTAWHDIVWSFVIYNFVHSSL